ncbi:MAG: hypothetical protein GKR87_05605 [Kiritimatiellae bacterium]|nr:hypothetical protein [Kiritimatiellia bacterium]
MKDETGKLQVHQRGFGFVILDNPYAEDIFIPEKYMGAGLDGDRVLISVHERTASKRGGEGNLLIYPLKPGKKSKAMSKKCWNRIKKS